MAALSAQAIQDEARHLLTLNTPHDVIAERVKKDRTTIWRWAKKWGFPTDGSAAPSAGEPSAPPSAPSAGEPSAAPSAPPSAPRASARTVRGVRAASAPSAAPSGRTMAEVEADNRTLRAQVAELQRQIGIMREAAVIIGQGIAR